MLFRLLMISSVVLVMVTKQSELPWKGTSQLPTKELMANKTEQVFRTRHTLYSSFRGSAAVPFLFDTTVPG
jgi:hypothetical protein